MLANTGSSPRLSARHVQTLDGLRGTAILIVMLHHFEFLLPSGHPVGNTVKNIFYTGWSGVDLFFVLSGFLITGILIDTKNASNYFSSFYARRILRIFPLYYCVLTLIVIFANVFYQPWFDKIMAIRPDQIYYFFYLNNWMFLLKDTWHGNIIGHFWSLAVEEQFYFVWPMCVWLTPARHLLKITLGGCAVALVLRIGLVAAYGPSQAIVQNTFARMDTLLMGATCAVIVRSEGMTARVKPLLVTTIITAAIGMLWIDIVQGEIRTAGVYMETGGFSLLAVGYAALLLKIFLGQGTASVGQKIFGSTVLRAMGKYSYGIYVLHVPILTIVALTGRQVLGLGVRPWPSIVTFLALLFVCFAAAQVSYELLESPFLRMKIRFRPTVKPEAPASAQVPASAV